MKIVFRPFLLITFITFGLMNLAQACEPHKSHSTDELKSLRDTMTGADVDPFDRLYAFQELVCSDKPVIRAFAIKEGLKNSQDEMVRNQILFDTLMQKTQITTVLYPKTADHKKTVKYFRGEVLVHNVKYRDQNEGCISFGSSSECKTKTSLFVRGGLVEYQDGNFGAIGSFRLVETNQLIGTVSVNGKNPVPASVELF
ncbi:MAG: hypothetical protein ABJQ71_22765 [Roseibium sp.]